MLLLNPRGAQEQPLEIKPPVSLRSLQSGTVNVEGRLIQDWCCFQVLSGKVQIAVCVTPALPIFREIRGGWVSDKCYKYLLVEVTQSLAVLVT